SLCAWPPRPPGRRTSGRPGPWCGRRRWRRAPRPSRTPGKGRYAARLRLTIWARPPGRASPLVGRQLDATGLVLPVAERVVRLHQLVDLARALVDHRGLAVPVEPAHRVLVGVPVAAVDLDRVAGRALA